MISTSGHTLLPDDAAAQLTRLLPLTTVLTPNVPEAKLIATRGGVLPSSEESWPSSAAHLEQLARAIRSLGPAWVLLKGGHLPLRRGDLVAATDADADADRVVVDVLVGPGESDVLRIQSPWLRSDSTHGTGCSLACMCALAQLC